MKRVILFNGPPSSGKDKAAEYLADQYAMPGIQRLEFKRELFRECATHYGVSLEDWIADYDQVKEIPWDAIGGISRRQAQIHVSEDLIKPTRGDQYFGQKVAQRIRESDYDVFVMSDSGFYSELQPILKLVGRDNLLLVRVHRPGFDFSRDSRTYLYSDQSALPFNGIDLFNNTTLDEYYEKVDTVFQAFMGIVQQYR